MALSRNYENFEKRRKAETTKAVKEYEKAYNKHLESKLASIFNPDVDLFEDDYGNMWESYKLRDKSNNYIKTIEKYQKDIELEGIGGATFLVNNVVSINTKYLRVEGNLSGLLKEGFAFLVAKYGFILDGKNLIYNLGDDNEDGNFNDLYRAMTVNGVSRVPQEYIFKGIKKIYDKAITDYNSNLIYAKKLAKKN